MDNLPNTLNNCTQIHIGDSCFIDLIWTRNPDITKIAFSARDDQRSIVPEHSLVTELSLEKKESDLIWLRRLSYICSTDQCNNLSTLKRLLTSLTLSDNFNELEYLLKREEPFDGRWCQFATNGTPSECATGIPPTSCQECSFNGQSNGGPIRLCSNCLENDIRETFVAHEVDFNMTDRTRSDHWILECRFQNCNTYDNGNMVRQKSVSNFDFVKFNQSSGLLSINKVALLFLVVMIKVLVN